MTTIFSEKAFIEDEVKSNVVIEIDERGVVTSVEDRGASGEGRAADVLLPGKLLVPAAANLHSHAFQRLLRGRTSRVSKDNPDADFWSWRMAMYAALGAMTPELFFEITKRCYEEMARAGYSQVVEFHYVHHQADGTPYEDRLLLSKLIIDAAKAAGLRICLARTVYLRGGFGIPANPRQRRFIDPSVDVALADIEALANLYASDPDVNVAACAHSVRAVDIESMRTVFELAERLDLSLHVHVSEQLRELAECFSEHGVTPVRLLADNDLLSKRVTLVHATHLDDYEACAIADSGASVCLCPTTEADLGDGVPRARELFERSVPLGIGSDSNVIIDPLREVSLLEFVQRLASNSRVALRRESRDGLLHGALALADVSRGLGTTSTGFQPPTIAVGERLEAFAVELDSAALSGLCGVDLLESLYLTGTRELITDVFLGSRRIPRV
ncbi:MAG: formimidoylglutamate deiminase [Planctomycetes bacterium]|nr:formimidoylglutamate deiminase [Planctomycetota bacterium]